MLLRLITHGSIRGTPNVYRYSNILEVIEEFMLRDWVMPLHHIFRE